MQSELISIIIPVYNCEKNFSKCIESIRRQTYDNIEIIIVNDGSTDNTLQCIEEQASKDKRIHYFSTENEGVSQARNFGLKNARGEYITFIDADDYVDECYCEKLYSAMINYDADISLCCAYDEVNALDNLKLNTIDNNKGEKNPICFSMINGYNYMNDDFSSRVVWGALYKSSVIEGIQFDREIYVAEDSLFFAQAVKRAKNIVRIYEYLYHYVIYENSASHGIFDEKKYTELEAWRRIQQIFNDVDMVRNSAKGRLAISCRTMIIIHYKNELFRNTYYKEVMNQYKENVQYIWKTGSVSLSIKMKAFSFLLCPALYIRMRNVRDESRYNNTY